MQRRNYTVENETVLWIFYSFPIRKFKVTFIPVSNQKSRNLVLQEKRVEALGHHPSLAFLSVQLAIFSEGHMWKLEPWQRISAKEGRCIRHGQWE